MNRSKAIILIIFIMLLMLVSYRIFVRNIISIEYQGVFFSPIDDDSKSIEDNLKYEFKLSDAEVNAIIESPRDYRLLYYTFTTTNHSKKINVYSLKFHPRFSKEMKKIVVGKDGYDDETPIDLPPESDYENNKPIIIKVKGFSESEITEFANKDTFMASCMTAEGNSFFSLGFNFEKVKFTGKWVD